MRIVTYKCKGICENVDVTVPFVHKYQKGFKRCGICIKYLRIFDVRCPCCSAKLRTKARYSAHTN